MSSLLLLPVSDARAGTYGSPVYTGGQYTFTPAGASQANPPLNYAPGGDGVSGYGNGSSNGAGTAACVGQITTTFPYTPAAGQTAVTDPPPSVIVTETCTASVGASSESDIANSPPAISGSCDDGLGLSQSSLPTTNSYPPPYYNLSEYALDTTTRYQVKSGMAPFVLTCNPSAKASYNGSSSLSVGYSASISPVTVKITGTNNPAQSDFRALAGQQITATLSGIPSGVKVTSYTWGFGGGSNGNPIKNWNGNGVAVDGTTPQQLFPFLTTDLTQTDTTGNGISVSPIKFYDQAADKTVTATCTVNLKFPDGTTANVKAVSPAVAFMKPTAYWTTNSDDASLGPQFNQQAMGYDEKWDAAITVLSPFSGGGGCFAQIVHPTTDFQRNPLGKQSVNCYYEVPQKNADGTTTYVLPGTGLDTYFPYQNSFTTHYPQGYTWNVNSPGQSGDAPSASFSIGAADNGGNNWYNAFSSDTFTTWLMYLPPVPAGSGPSIWVPLQSIGWGWTGSVVKNNATGQWNSAVNSQAPVTGFTSSTGIPTDTPPQWSSVITGTNVLYPLY